MRSNHSTTDNAKIYRFHGHLPLPNYFEYLPDYMSRVMIVKGASSYEYFTAESGTVRA